MKRFRPDWLRTPAPANAPPVEGGHPHDLVLKHARRDFATLRQEMTAGEALAAIRERGLGERIVYFYIVDAQDRLVGVLPVRRLLTAPLEARLADLDVDRPVALPRTATVLEACEYFHRHRFLAFPVVDDEGRVLAVADIDLFAHEIEDIAARTQVEEAFESIGFRISQLRRASPAGAAGIRFPWLLATITSGTACALLAGAFADTLARALILAFFITLVLALAESVSIQSMTITIQALRFERPTVRWYAAAAARELATAVLLGLACGALVAGIVALWRGAPGPALVIGGSICLSLLAACFFGLTIPSLLHTLRLDPKIAAGPLTLALADVTTILVYFTLGSLFL